jgi:HEAT repeat protein
MRRMRTVVLVMVGVLVARRAPAQAPELARAQAAMARASAAVQAVQPSLAELQGLQSLAGLQDLASFQSLASLQDLEGLKDLAGLAQVGDLQGLAGLEDVAGLEGLDDPDPAAGPQQDPSDSLYRAGREALNAGRYKQAVGAFERIIQSYRGSPRAGDAIYWLAFVNYRMGGTQNLQQALSLLDQQKRLYPDAATRRDGEVLATRIRGDLARLGNADAAESTYVTAGARGAARAGAQAACASGDEDNDVRLAALNALLQMDSERALPILKQVLQRRDACSVELRRKAVFLVSQKRGPDVEDVLLEAARNDPDREVRTQAVFWLSQVNSDRAVTALDSVLMGSKDQEVQEKAIFALSQHQSPRAAEILRRFVDRPDASEDLKEKAIFWIGQQNSPENLKYLEDVYPRLSNDDLKEKLIFSISQMNDDESSSWLMALALNPNEKLELRKKALFWAGQKHEVGIADLTKLYDTMNDRDMKEQLIFVYSQRNEPAAVDKLMAIAENEKDPELRRKAIFWLGQSKDPRVADFLARLISK